MFRANLFLGLMLATGLSPAKADETSALANACRQASNFYSQNEWGAIESEQSFPELDPPRVQIVLASESSSFSHLARCTFTSPQPPFGLTQYCIDHACDLAPGRLEELQILMQRAGY